MKLEVLEQIGILSGGAFDAVDLRMLIRPRLCIARLAHPAQRLEFWPWDIRQNRRDGRVARNDDRVQAFDGHR